MVGVERGTVELVEYREEWRRLADVERSHLQDLLGDEIEGIEHVGSTAIEGMAAKPVIDLLAVVEEHASAPEYATVLEPDGYELRENDQVPDRLFFAKGPAEERTHYLSITERGSECHREQIAFRDYLRSNPDAAAEYRRLKLELEKEYPDDRESYTERKSAFVRKILERAADEE